MLRRTGVVLLGAFCAGLLFAWLAGAQVRHELLARRRILPDVGPGFRALKRDPAGRYCVLTAPGGILLYDASGKRVGQIPPVGLPATVAAALVYGDDLDVDAAGRLYVADRGGNAVKVFNPDGALALAIPITAPTSVAVLSEGEIAVASLKSTRLVSVFAGPGTGPADTGASGKAAGNSLAPGKVIREFGDPTEIAERSELNRFLNVGRLASDPAGHIYYAFSYLPEPTVRKYDRNGYASFEIAVRALEFQSVAQAARREIARQERGGTPALKPIVTAVGVDPETQEIWVAMGGLLLHFDRAGNRRSTYRTFTPEGARLEATAILVEPDRLLLGSDPLGIYDFPRPDKTRP